MIADESRIESSSAGGFGLIVKFLAASLVFTTVGLALNAQAENTGRAHYDAIKEISLGSQRQTTRELWSENQWRIWCRDNCYRPKTLCTWEGSRPTLLNGTEDRPLESDRPDFTEASSCVGYRRVQLEAGYTFLLDNSAVDTTAHSFPETLLRIGMFAEWFEARIGWNYGVNLTRENIVSSVFDGGQDLYVGAKIALTEQDGWRPETAIMPQMNLPTGHADLTSGEVEPGINFLYGWDITDVLAAGGSTQANRGLDDADVWFAELAQSFTLNYTLTDKLGGYTEWFAFFPSGAAVALPQYYFDGGFTYRVHNNLQLDLRAGVGLNEAADDFFAGSGVVFRL